ncbi:MAG: bifunctional nicotinamidase/pyrazinamidase [Nannocystis sp.]|nr:bifunctional nicotinamidase/pyrazinamidase [Nannocystis sp.]
MKALILVDLQYDFMPGGALAVPDGDAVVPLANRLQGAFELVVATQDWHPANHGSFAANHPGRAPGEVITLGGLPQVLWPTHCVQGSRGAELVAALDTSRIAAVLQKGCDPEIDSYSGFFDNGGRRSTGLGEFLQARGVEEVFVLGLATDYCVRFTALDALGLKFKRVSLVVDACRAVDLSPGDGEAALAAMRAAGVEMVRSASLLSPSRSSTP